MAPVVTLFLLVTPVASDAPPPPVEQLEEPAPAPLGLLVGPALGGAVGVGGLAAQWLLLAGGAVLVMLFCPCLGTRDGPIQWRAFAGETALIASACLLFSSPVVLMGAATADAAGMMAGQVLQRRGQKRLLRDTAITGALWLPTVLGSLASVGTCCGLYCGTWIVGGLYLASPATQNAMMYGAVAGSLALAALSTVWWMLATFVVRPIAVGVADQLFR